MLLSLASASASSLPNLTVHPAISALSLRTTASNLYKRNHYNVILLLGPLYHLLHHTERVEVLSICKEMLRPGGVLISAFISRAGHLRRVALKEPKRLGAQWEGFYQGTLLIVCSDRYNHITSTCHPNVLSLHDTVILSRSNSSFRSLTQLYTTALTNSLRLHLYLNKSI